MPQPGRRPHSASIWPTLSFTSIFLLLVFSTQALAASAVLGIDLGTGYIKATLVKPGIPLEIVITKDSKRKEAAAIAFKPSDGQSYPERLYGGDATALAARFPHEVYPNLKPLLAEHLSSVKGLYEQRYPAVQVVSSSEGSLGVRSSNFAEDEPLFTVQELLAMELQNIRHNAQVMAGKSSTIRSTVITIPPYYTAEEKTAVAFAAQLAGLEVMSLISDGMAVGLNYAMTRTFPNTDKGEKAEHHLVYDLGSGSTSATILKFQARNVKDIGRFNKTVQEVSAVGTGWNTALGGDLFNDYIVKDMVIKFVESPAAKKSNVQLQEVKKHGRTMAKLSKEAERLRLVLSANTAASANFEELFAEVDFRYKISRAEFEALLGDDVIQHIGEPIRVALEMAQLKADDLDSVVLHGGVVRTPFVQKALESIVGDAAKLKTNVNADESAAFGAGFKAASLSPSFRVKEIRVVDAANYAVDMEWTHLDKVRKQKIFQASSLIGPSKRMTFKNLEDFTLLFKQLVPSQATGGLEERPVSRVVFTNLTVSTAELTEKYGCKKANITNSVTIRLDPSSGLPEVSDASVSCEVDPERKASLVDGVKGLFGFGGKKDDESSDTDAVLEEEATSSSSTTESTSATASPTPSKKGKVDKKKAKEAADEPAKPQIQTIKLSYTTTLAGRALPSGEEFTRIVDRLAAFDKADADRVERSETFNSLEAFIYRGRDMLTEVSFIEASKQAERTAFEKAVQAAGSWISEDGIKAPLDVVKTKLKELKDLVNPITKRKDEAAKRPVQIELLASSLNRTQTLLKTIKKEVEKAASEAAEAAKSALESSTASSETSSAETSASPAPSDDAVDGLDDEAYASVDSPSTSETSKPSPTPTIFKTAYTEADLTEFTALFDRISEWFTDKQEAQSKLSPSDDPTLLAADMLAKTDELNQAWTRFIQKRFQVPPKPKTSKAKTSKSKTKSAKGSKKSANAKSQAESESSVPIDTPTADPLEEQHLPTDAASDTAEAKPASTIKLDHEEL